MHVWRPEIDAKFFPHHCPPYFWRQVLLDRLAGQQAHGGLAVSLPHAFPVLGAYVGAASAAVLDLGSHGRSGTNHHPSP